MDESATAWENDEVRTLPLFVAGMFRDRALADRVITALLDAGVPSSEISLAVRERAEEDVSRRGEEEDADNPFAELAVHSAWERLGWQGGARPAYRDRIPPDIELAILAAGPLAIAIGGAQVGAAAGGVPGTMTNFGFTHEMARQWYGRIIEGQAWVMVRTNLDEGDKVRKILDRFQAELRADSLRHW